MDSAYAHTAHSSTPDLAGLAARMEGPRNGLPALFLFTDPQRTPDPAAIMRGLPPRCGVVFRHFGAADREAAARTLRAACDAGGHLLLIAADPDLARAAKADGVHWPSWMTIPGRIELRRFRVNTASAHNGVEAARAARAGADIVFLSPVFRSASPSAGAPLGVARASAIARAAPCPVYALGGITAATAPLLLDRGFSGLAAIGALADPATLRGAAP